MSVELPYRPTLEDMHKDWPTSETVQQWRELFQKEDNVSMQQRRELIIRHIAYARERIEKIMKGSRLSTIDLCDLRRYAEESIQAAIQSVGIEGMEVDPVDEIMERFLSEVMGVPFGIRRNIKDNDMVSEYLFRKHEKIHRP